MSEDRKAVDRLLKAIVATEAWCPPGLLVCRQGRSHCRKCWQAFAYGQPYPPKEVRDAE